MAITVTPALLADDFGAFVASADGSYSLGVGVTPSDSAQSLTFVPRALLCTAAGNVCVMWRDGTTSVFSMAVGVPLRVRPYAIPATGTTATGIIALK